MRTTIRMNEALARQVKQFAAETNRTFTSVIEEAVAKLLAERRNANGKPRKRKRITLPKFGGQGIVDGLTYEQALARADEEEIMARLGIYKSQTP